MSEPLYELRQVEKAYHGRSVLHIDELAVYPGEILALVGPSGV